jgi:hypothetical protein
MSCRSTFSGSAFTTFARLASPDPISDVATLSAFHRLRREYIEAQHSPWQAPRLALLTGPDQYQDLLTGLRDEVAADPSLSEARRASLLARLESATDQVPDPGTIYALRMIKQAVRAQAGCRAGFLASYASHMGVSLEQAQARFAALENGIARSRSAGDPDTVTQASIDEASNRGLGIEAGTVHAYVTMRDEAAAAEAATLAVTPTRFTRDQIVTDPFTHGQHTFELTEIGRDPRTGYTEITVVDRSTGEVTTRAYHRVSEYDMRQLSDPHTASSHWTSRLRAASWMEFSTPEEAARAAAAPRCALCGQFSAVGHSCPTSIISTPVTAFALSGDYRRNGATSGQAVTMMHVDSQGVARPAQVRIDLPLVAGFRQAGRDGSILLEGIHQYLPGGSVLGDLGVLRTEDGQLEFNVAQLRCNCQDYQRNYRCEHVDTYVRAVRTRLNPPARTPAAQLTPEERQARAAAAQARAEALAATDWATSQAGLADAARTWRTDAVVSYSEDFDAFDRVYQHALTQTSAKNGAAVIPFIRENALDGMATRESGQAFGMEIEYEFPAEWSHERKIEANRAIGQALQAANLTDSAEQKPYHAATTAGFIDTHVHPQTGKGTWSWERDGSVSGGELVTPGMYDEPETWAKLETAVEILKANGAIATARAGAHVHVGTAMYAGDPRKYAELAQLMVQHEDVMFRLAQDPARKSHRQGGYSQPLPDAPSGGWRDLGHVKAWQGGRTKVLNLGHVAVPRDPMDQSASAKDHPEFRIFDSSLDVGVMQSQIKLSVAMTHAAARAAEAGGTTRVKEHLGAHLERTSRRRREPTREDQMADTASFRSLMDTLFAREVDKAQLTAVFANTAWNAPDASNKRAQRQAMRQRQQQ